MSFKNIFYFRLKDFDLHARIMFFDVKIYLKIFIQSVIAIFKIHNIKAINNLRKLNEQKSILIFEPNNFHSDTFHSWLFYFSNTFPDKKLIFLASSKIHNIKPFDVYDYFSIKNSDYFFLKIDPILVLFLYYFGFFKKFKKFIFNSDIFEFSKINDFHNLLKTFTNKDILSNSLFLSHSILQSLKYAKNIDKNHQLLTISKAISNNVGINFFTPIYNIRSVEENNKDLQNFNNVKKFISCGNIKIKCKDAASLEDSLDLFSNKPNAKLTIVGKSPKSLLESNFVSNYKNIPFGKLSILLTKNHFILFLLSKENSYQYKHNSASGSFALALNFNLIPIIEESFASQYCLDENCAILHQNGKLRDAIRKATAMDLAEYLFLQKNLHQLKLKLFEESSNNIKSMLM